MRLANEAELPSPSLVLHWERVEDNLRRMLDVAGSAGRLRPHIKTHKLPQIVARQMALGINKFKCATVAEAEMAATVGAADVLLAMQPVGPNISRLLQLMRTFPRTQFSTICDDPAALRDIARSAAAAGLVVEVLVDLDVGQGRTGIAPGVRAQELYKMLLSERGVRPGGLHAYDGHLQQSDPAERGAACEAAFAPVDKLRTELRAMGLPLPRVVVGGTPTFPMHARRFGVECSPGTCVLWDAGYASKLPDLHFLSAATVLTRVISRPEEGRLCLDLGHKAVASEMAHPRVVFPALPDARVLAHNEEHLVLETIHAKNFVVGSVLHGIPWHVCPTVALHGTVQIAKKGRVDEEWPVTARTRRLSV